MIPKMDLYIVIETLWNHHVQLIRAYQITEQIHETLSDIQDLIGFRN